MAASDRELARPFVMREPGSGWVGAWGLRNQGTFHAYWGRFDPAVEAYRRAAGLSPSGDDIRTLFGATALQALAPLLALKGDDEGARDEADRALSMQPENPMCLYFAGRFALKGRDTAIAEGHLRKIQRILSTTRRVMGDVYRDCLEAEIQLASGRPGDALRLFEKTVTSQNLLLDWGTTYCSSGAAMRDGLIRCYLALGETEKAAGAMKTLLESGLERLNHPVIYVRTLYQLGLLEIERGDETNGRKYLESFLEHWGNADWEIAEVHEARKRLP